MTDGANARSEMQMIREQHQALAVLRLLERETNGAANNRLLNDMLRFYAPEDLEGHLVDCLRRLESEGLVTTREVAELIVVELREMGENVALGRKKAESVMKAWPDCPY
jgi:DNA-binding PadR family transcriptional regulator